MQNGYSKAEEEKIFDATVQDVLDNTRWYLDNLDRLVAYRVSWKDYRNPTATLPKRFKQDKKGEPL